MSDRALVRNGSDPDQVNRARRKTREAERQRLGAIAEVMKAPAGRRVMWDLLCKARVFESIWNPSAAIHYNAGRQDFGHELMADLLEADETLYELMEREARTRAKREQGQNDAAATAAATGGQDDGGDSDSREA